MSSRQILSAHPSPLRPCLEGVITGLLCAPNEIEECAACAALLLQLNERGATQASLAHMLALQRPTRLGEFEDLAAFPSMLEEFLFYFMVRKYAKQNVRVSEAISCNVESLAAYAQWEWLEPPGEELRQHFQNLERVFLQCEWSVESLNGWYHLISSLQEPCLRQSALQFCFQILHNILGKDATTSLKVHQDGDSADKMEHHNCTMAINQVCTQIMLLGITDVWSAIRKECAQKAVRLVFMLPAMEAIDTFIEQLLHVAVGSEYVRTQDTTRLTQWRERDGALYTLSLILKSIEIDESSRDLGRTNDLSAILATRVASDIKGRFCGSESATAFQFGACHTNVTRLPRSLAQTLKPVLYQCLRHDQLSVRENAAQCLKQYVDLCEEPMRLAIFQEVISKLNRMKESHDDNSSAEQELLETYEAEGLLDVLGKLVPSLPSQFLLKHWKIIFPTLDKYVMHISSSVRQKSSAVVLSLAKLTRKRSCDAAVELLLKMLLSLSEQPHDSNNFCWQQKEGRLLSIDLLVNFLGKDLLLGKYGTKLLNSVTQQHELRKGPRNFDEKENQWANVYSSLATWTVDDDDMFDLSASSDGDVHESGQPQSALSLVDLINEFAEKKAKNTGKSAASEFWQRVLTGWLCQTRQAFTSNQFELRRISRQILPGLVRLSIWLSQQELIGLDEANFQQVDVTWFWSCLKYVLLHLRFRQEALGTLSAVESDVLAHEATQVGLKCAWKLLEALVTTFDSSLDGCTAVADTETTVVIVEVQLMAFLMFAQSLDNANLMVMLLEKSLGIVHRNLPADMQLTDQRLPKRSSDSSLDRQLSISLVHILPSVVTTFRSVVASLHAVNGQAKPNFLGNRSENCWWILERAALAWLATDDMFRWITVDPREARTLLLKTLDQLLQFLPQHLEATFPSTEFDLTLNQVKNLMSSSPGSQNKFIASARTHIFSIYLSVWRVASAGKEPTNRVCQDLVSFYSQLRHSDQQSSAGKDTSNPKESSDWDDWDQDGDDTQPEGEGRDKASETRMTATVYEHVSQLNATDHVLLTILMSWKRDELDCMRESLSSSFGMACDVHEQSLLQVNELLTVIDSARSS